MSCCICFERKGNSVCPRCPCTICLKCWNTYTVSSYKDHDSIKCPLCRYEGIEVPGMPETRSKTQPRRKAMLVREISNAISSTNKLPFSEEKMKIVRGIFQRLHVLRKSDVDLLDNHLVFKETVRLKLLEMYNVDGWQGAATYHILLYGYHPESSH